MEMESPQNSTDEGSQGTFERRPKKTKRFTTEQIIALESIFKVETKLEPRKKVQVARDLGLQPRQVAIWFQNRRARWKSKHTEQELRALRGNFDSLSMQFDGLKKENLTLQMQLQELRDLVKNLDNTGSSYKEKDFKEYANSQNELGIDDHHFVHSDEENIAKYLKKKEEEKEEEEEDLSNLAASEEWCKVSYTGLFDQSSATSDWWQS